MDEQTDVVAKVRAAVIERLQWAGPEITEDVLTRISGLPYVDLDSFLTDVQTAITIALQPLLDAAKAKAAEAHSKAEAAQARCDEIIRREMALAEHLERFRALPVSDCIH